MRRRVVALQQSSGAQHQRSRAHRRDVFCVCRLRAQKVQRLLVVDEVVGAHAAGHADHIELRTIRKGDGRRQHQHGIARHRLDALPDQVNFRAGQAGEHLQRPGEIELGHFWKQQQTDLQRLGHDDLQE